MDDTKKSLPTGTTLALRGEVKTMQDSFVRLGIGIIFALALVYLLMAVNFQSWLDPLIILMAIPGAFCGILWMLFATQTTFSVPSLMGAIMTIGVATANSILMVVFANDERLLGKNQYEAALNAGFTRLRPVCMTALAMIIGMLPMALAFGEGGEQNAPAWPGCHRRPSARDRRNPLHCSRHLLATEENTAHRLLQRDRRRVCRRRSQRVANEGAARLMPTPDYNPDQWPEDQRLANSFADPNSLDDQKLGNAFVETNSSKKKKHHDAPQPNKKPINGRILFFFIIAVVIVFLLVFLLGFLPRHSRNKEIEARAKDQKDSVPVVQVQQIKRAQDTAGLTVPGTTTPLIEAYVYARLERLYIPSPRRHRRSRSQRPASRHHRLP